MEQINKFNNRIDEVEKISDLEKKSQSVKEIKDELKSEQEKVEIMIEKISNIKPKKSKKFKGMNLEKLSEMFEEEKDLDKKLKIYQHISYLIDMTKNQLFEEN